MFRIEIWAYLDATQQRRVFQYLPNPTFLSRVLYIKGKPFALDDISFALDDIFISFRLVFSSWIWLSQTSSDRVLLKTGCILQRKRFQYSGLWRHAVLYMVNTSEEPIFSTSTLQPKQIYIRLLWHIGHLCTRLLGASDQIFTTV